MKNIKKLYQCECGISLMDEETYKKHIEFCGKIGRERFDAKIKIQKDFIQKR